MRSLIILNKELIYRKEYDQSFSEFSSNNPRTGIYIQDGLVEELKWSWRKLKKIPTGKLIPNYVKICTLYYWIETDSSISKDKLTEKLEKELTEYLTIKNRKIELEKGQLI